MYGKQNFTHALARNFSHCPANLSPVHDDEENYHNFYSSSDGTNDNNFRFPMMYVLPVHHRYLGIAITRGYKTMGDIISDSVNNVEVEVYHNFQNE